MFKGVDFATGASTGRGSGFTNDMVVYALRVDLSDPDVRLFSSPRITNYVQGTRETAGYTVRDFLVTNRLQVAINAAQFSPSSYYLPAGTPMNPAGLSICQGVLVSPQDGIADAASIMFTSNNIPTIVPTNWPPVSTAGVFTAVTGPYPLLLNGVNLGYRYLPPGSFIHEDNPRTALGISQDRRYLFILVIDGRQPGYSTGALDFETGLWLLTLGAYNAINLDGGGSSTLVVEDSTGQPVTLNHPSAVADSGKQRTVGSHFGLFAKPVPTFIGNLTALPDDTAATITWTTPSPASSQVRYGPTPDLEFTTPLQSALLTNHAVLLSGLAPATPYYYHAISVSGATQHISSNFVFTTTNYITTTDVFGLDHTWSFSTANLDATAWTSPNYDDSSWTGAGPGLLWADSRGPNSEISPLGTQMPLSAANNGYPFFTYYFRTRFNLPDPVPGLTLIFTGYLDDGAVFYLNGTEIHRFYMEEAPAPIDNSTLAIGYGCESGNATCLLSFTVSGDLATNLVAGDNLLAAEVHNYSARSPDITFGFALACTQPLFVPPVLDFAIDRNNLVLSWDRGGFTLEQAPSPAGPWTDVPGPVVSSPYVAPAFDLARFFRLRK